MRKLSIVIPVVLAAFGCGGEENSKVCDSGAQRSCACPSGTDGVQACAEDGLSWQACACGCASGTHDGGDGSCVADGTCAAGYREDASGECVAASCTEGLHDDGAGTCVAAGCTAGFVEKEGVCVRASSGDITFLWSFGGQSCQQTPSARWVRVTLTGVNGQEQLDNDGFYYCSLGGSDGIRLRDFEPGPYDYVIEGLGSDETALYRASGSLTVDGNVTVNVELAPVEPPA